MSEYDDMLRLNRRLVVLIIVAVLLISAVAIVVSP